MDDTRLDELLRRADGAGAVSAPAPEPDLPRRLLSIDRRRRAVRRGAMTAGSFAVVVLAVLMTPMHRGPLGGGAVANRVTPVGPRVVAPGPADLAALAREAELHTAVADKLVAIESARGAAATAAARAPERPVETAALVREKAAMVLVTQGDWSAAARDLAAARRDYARAAALFAGTQAASVARSRLEQIDAKYNFTPADKVGAPAGRKDGES